MVTFFNIYIKSSQRKYLIIFYKKEGGAFYKEKDDVSIRHWKRSKFGEIGEFSEWIIL